jgi:alkylation response protein AidB-like acyl-CoA dehydrogenase
VTPSLAGSEAMRIAALRAEAVHRFGRFISERVNPGADERDRLSQPLPRELLMEAGRLGLLGFSLPNEIGGEGRDRFEWGIVVQELARLSRDPAFSSLIDLNAGIAELLLATGRPEFAARYAAPMAAGRFVCPPAAYESRDPFDYLTTATQSGDVWVLEGNKPLIGAALIADAFLVYAKDTASGDILAFLVERDDHGVRVDPIPTMGLHSMGFGSLTLDRVHLGADRLVVEADALSTMNSYLRNRRVMTACAVVGSMRALFEDCVIALDDRQRSGRGVLEFPNVQRTVGEMFVAVEASQAIVHQALAATFSPRDQFFDPIATAAKQFVAEQAIKIGLAVMNLHGGHGYMTHRPWERYMRDALSLIGGQGAQELLLIQLGQHATLELTRPFVHAAAAVASGS